MRDRATRILTLACLLAAPFSGCLNGGGTEIPNEVRGTLYTSAGTPAANATVTLYPVNYTPGTASGKVAAKKSADPIKVSATTNASGQYVIKDLPEGEYNVLASGNDLYAFQDSVALTGSGVRTILADTLRAAGTLTGTVQLQPQHSPQTATVQVLGTDYYTNVASNGKFTLTLPRGTYRLRVSTILADYVPLFVVVSARSGMNDTLAEPLEPFYANIPVVTGLTAAPDSTGGIVLRWKKPAFGNVQTYLIYRDPVGTIVPSTTPYASAADTTFLDTIYTRIASTATQLPYFDTALKSYTYRVRILDVSDNTGPVFGSVSATSFPPAKLYKSGRWIKALENAPFAATAADYVRAVVFQDKIWVIRTRKKEIWSSGDGVNWTLASTLPLASTAYVSAALTFKNELWVVTQKDPNYCGSIPCRAPQTVFSGNSLWKSANGVNWELVLDSLPLPKCTDCNFYEFQDKLWMAGGGVSEYIVSSGAVYLHASGLYSSPNGVDWTNAAPSPGYMARWLNTAALFDGKIWMSGTDATGLLGNDGIERGVLGEGYFANSADGTFWSTISPADNSELLMPRKAHAMIAHDGALWILGGYVKQSKRSGTLPLFSGLASAEVWRSTDGITWQIIDANAPFGPRVRPQSVSFQGKVWVLGGGSDKSGDGIRADVWYYQ